MNFYSVRDLRTASKTMWQNLSSGDEVIITNNGKPSALMIEIPEADSMRSFRLSVRQRL